MTFDQSSILTISAACEICCGGNNEGMKDPYE
jgi:hypothetical protein